MRCRLILAAVVAVSLVSLTSVNAADLLDKVMTVSYENGCGGPMRSGVRCGSDLRCSALCGALRKSCCTPCRVKVCKPCKPARCCKPACAPACGAEPACGAAAPACPRGAPACGAEPSCGAAPSCCVERCRPCLLEKAACRVRGARGTDALQTEQQCANVDQVPSVASLLQRTELLRGPDLPARTPPALRAAAANGLFV